MWAWIGTLRKSMFAQMAVLTALFLGWGLYAFVLKPIFDMPPAARAQRPLQATESELRTALHQFVVASRTDSKGTPSIAQSPVIAAVQARNPGFRYYVRVDDRTFGNGEPLMFERLRLDRVVRAHRELTDAGICSQMEKIVDGAGGDEYASFHMCDRLTYFEYRNLKNPIEQGNVEQIGIFDKLLRPFSGNFLLAAGGVFAIFALIFSVHIRSIRRIARLARSIDPQRLDAKLPEKGVATEILPLVRAVNHLIGEVDAAQRRSTFFLSAAAHEMRTPLTVLRTRLELMEDGAQKDKLVGDVQRLTALVNQLLKLMSIGNRRDVTGFADIVAVGRKAMRQLASVAETAGVGLRFESDAPALEVPGEETLIESAISNLIDNAISFAPPGSVVEVRVNAAGAVTVRDHGPGLGEGDPARLFEPFARPAASRRGFGLGLAIVSAVARLHGGSARAANAPGGGAEFVVTFSSSTLF